MALGTQADVEARVGGPQAFLRLFDRDRDGAADAAVFTAADTYATSQIYSKLRASHPGVKFDDPGPVDPLIVDLWARLVIGYAGEMSPGANIDPRTGRSPYGGMKREALADLTALASNAGQQLPTGAPAPSVDSGAAIYAPAGIWQGSAGGGCDSDPDRGTGGGYSGF